MAVAVSQGPVASLSLPSLLARLRRQWWLVPLGGFTGLLLGALALLILPVTYAAVAVIVPAIPDEQVNAAFLGGLVGDLTGATATGAFEKFYASMTSEAVAQRLVDHSRVLDILVGGNWQRNGSTWTRLHTPLAISVKGFLDRMFSVPFDDTPGVDTVVHFVESLSPTQRSLTRTYFIELRRSRRADALNLLGSVLRETDQYLREQEQKKVTQRIDTLTQTAGKADNLQLREQLALIIGGEMKYLAELSSEPFFAINILDIHADRNPVSPNPLLVLVAMAGIGVLVPALLLLIMDLKSREA